MRSGAARATGGADGRRNEEPAPLDGSVRRRGRGNFSTFDSDTMYCDRMRETSVTPPREVVFTDDSGDSINNNNNQTTGQTRVYRSSRDLLLLRPPARKREKTGEENETRALAVDSSSSSVVTCSTEELQGEERKATAVETPRQTAMQKGKVPFSQYRSPRDLLCPPTMKREKETRALAVDSSSSTVVTSSTEELQGEERKTTAVETPRQTTMFSQKGLLGEGKKVPTAESPKLSWGVRWMMNRPSRGETPAVEPRQTATLPVKELIGEDSKSVDAQNELLLKVEAMKISGEIKDQGSSGDKKDRRGLGWKKTLGWNKAPPS